jgi:PAS domain S-box-containing protein
LSSPEALLARILEQVPQPVWVVDHSGVITFANPAACSALGYRDPGELRGKPSHETVHYKRQDGTPYPAAECLMLRPRQTGETVHSDDDWFVRRDGSMFPIAWWSAPIDMPGGRGAVLAFTDISERLASEKAIRERDAAEIHAAESRAAQQRNLELADQQAALRRVATLVARGASPSEVFAAVSNELAHVLHVVNAGLLRFEPDATGLVVAVQYEAGITQMPVTGERIPLAGDDVGARVLHTGRPARIDNHARAPGPEAERIRESGIHSIVGVPVIVDGRLWGAAIVGSRRLEPMPPDTEARIGDFADLVATAIANAATRSELQASQDELRMLAEQQAALRRVATLVARGTSPSEVFAAVAEGMARCLHAGNASVNRFDGDTVTVLALARIEPGMEHKPVVGERHTLEGDSIASRVFHTGRPARLDSSELQRAPGSIAERLREMGLRCTVAVPIIVDKRVWGMAAVGSAAPDPLPPDTEARIGDFADLVATAVANAATRAELVASRARIVTAGDEARRRLERDLHDGAQQRLVSLGLQLRVAEEAMPPELDEFRGQLAQVLAGLTGVSADLQEISRGIHPAILSKGGLGPALKTLARRSSVPVDLDLTLDRRLPDSIEVAAYYVVAEALTNAAKHAAASLVNVGADTHDATLRLLIRDDGIGGADSRKGSGLIGLQDRVEALGGHMEITSPPGSGTSVHISIPLGGK